MRHLTAHHKPAALTDMTAEGARTTGILMSIYWQASLTYDHGLSHALLTPIVLRRADLTKPEAL